MTHPLELPNLIKPALIVGAVAATLLGTAAGPAAADEAAARQILKAMSDHLAEADAIGFRYDATFDVVTDEGQTLGVASSGRIVLERPGRVMATRTGGFTSVEIRFDGKDGAIVGKNANAYATIEAEDVDALIDALHDEYGFPLPGADLLVTDAYAMLMADVTDVKDLGAGVIGGTQCDHLAFRTELVDWQIYVTQGDAARPCRYVITSTDIPGAPRYQLDFADWTTGEDVPDAAFTYEPAEGARQVSLEELRTLASDLPPQFKIGEK